MIRFILIFFILIHLASASSLRLQLPVNIIKQGSLVDARAVINSETIQQIESQKLKGINLADTIYIHQVGPLVKKNNNDFEAEVKIIFLKIPRDQSLIHKIDEKELTITWSKVEILPTEAPEKLIFGNFIIPEKLKIFQWVLSIFGLILGFLIFYKLRKRFLNKKEIKIKKEHLKNSVISGNTYDDVVKIWQQKEMLLSEFPHLRGPFIVLEKVLFKYQFKLFQTEQEKEEVLKAYREFISLTAGGFIGV